MRQADALSMRPPQIALTPDFIQIICESCSIALGGWGITGSLILPHSPVV